MYFFLSNQDKKRREKSTKRIIENHDDTQAYHVQLGIARELALHEQWI